MSENEKSYWYIFHTGKVEHGFESPAIDRAGPFATPEEAAKAPELLKSRARAWAADDEAEDTWGLSSDGTSE